MESHVRPEIETASLYEINTEEVQEIITSLPSWIVRWGITIIFTILVVIVASSYFISYPDIVKAGLKVNSLDAPKSVFCKQNGKIVSLLVKEGTLVKKGQSLGFMESTANHRDVIKLHAELIHINANLDQGLPIGQAAVRHLNLGELQSLYQNYFQQYLEYASTQRGGYYLNRSSLLHDDLLEIEALRKQIVIQQSIQEKEFANVEQEFESYKKLYQRGVVSRSEYKQQENRYLSGKYPQQQTNTNLLNNKNLYLEKQKEILELAHIIQDEKAKYIESLNNMITETEAWLNKYVMTAPVTGTVSFAGITQENQTVNANDEIFIINPANTNFFGEIDIPQYSMGKVKINQQVIIKLRGYPFEQYGAVIGRISYISDAAFKDSVFIAKVSFEQFENKDPNHKIIIKNSMYADAEIITDESSLLKRFMRNFTGLFNRKI